MKKRIFKVVPVDADILGLAVDFRFRGHRREVVEDEAVETLQTRLDPLGRAAGGDVVVLQAQSTSHIAASDDKTRLQ